MTLHIAHPEILGVSESSLTVAFTVNDATGPVDADAQVRLNGEVRATSTGGAATRLLRIEDLAPATEYRVEIQSAGAASAEPDAYFPEHVTTLPAPTANCVGTFGTLNDLHFGEARMGGKMSEDMEYGDEAEGFPVVRASDTDTPYTRFMNEDAVGEINAAGVDLAIIKGDIADRGLPEQFEEARKVFDGFEMPHHAFLGNHDYLEHANGREVDGYALLGQPPAPRVVELGGWRLVLLETNDPGLHPGHFDEERRNWLEECLRESEERKSPTLLLMHHHPVPPEHVDSYPNSIGLNPEHSVELFSLLGRSSQTKGVLIGHTHRNRVRRYAASGSIPYAEVHNSKDYPGGWGHYRLFEDGSFRQEVRRTATERALAHSAKCRDLFKGFYRKFTFGALADRSFVAGAES